MDSGWQRNNDFKLEGKYMSTIEIIEAILRDEFPDIKNIKANIIANRILDAIEDMETERQ